MISRIRAVIEDCATYVDAILDSKKKKVFKYRNVWNDQINELVTGDNYVFQRPSVFFEFIPGECMMLGGRVSSYPNAIIRLHIITELLNSENMDQNLISFDIRDDLKYSFIGKNPRFCSGLECAQDILDYNHGSIYVYILDFKTNFIDTRGSMFDDTKTNFATLNNPTISFYTPPPPLGLPYNLPFSLNQ